jgi:hypothetical protein
LNHNHTTQGIPQNLFSKRSLRLSAHFQAITLEPPSAVGSKKPGERVGDRFRAFVRAAVNASIDVGVPANFFSEADFKWLLAELRRSSG